MAEQIVRATYPDHINKLPLTNIKDGANISRIRKTFAELLDSTPSTQDIRVFISAYHSLLQNIVGYTPFLVPAYKLSSTVPFDFALVNAHGVSGPVDVQLIVLGPASNTKPTEQHEPMKRLLMQIETELGPKVQFNERPKNDYLGPSYVGEYSTITDAMRKLITLLPRGGNIHWDRPEVWSFRFLVIMGRRNLEAAAQRGRYMQLVSYKLDIASYDRLID